MQRPQFFLLLWLMSIISTRTRFIFILIIQPEAILPYSNEAMNRISTQSRHLENGNIIWRCAFSFFFYADDELTIIISREKTRFDFFFFFLFLHRDNPARYWSLHGGNLYSPGPCANAGAPPGSGTQCVGHQGGPGVSCPAHHHHHHHRRSGGSSGGGSGPAWNWLPWRPAVSDSSDLTARTR